MKKILTGAAALLATTTIASAGGLDRTNQPVTALFERGNYAELSFASINPRISGKFGAADSGDITPTYGRLGAAIKWDLTDQFSMAIIYDQPFGAKVSYTEGDAAYPLTGTVADVTSNGITALARYKINDNFSVHGGLRYVSVKSSVTQVAGGVTLYDMTAEEANGLGYVVGAAYERPEIALRAAITYSSSIDLEPDTSGTAFVSALGATLPFSGKMPYTLPQSVNIDLQTGVAPGTLVFANIRWADWKQHDVNGLTPAPGVFNDLVDYDSGKWSYTIGVGRQFSEKFAGSFSYTYEPSEGGLATNLAPVDGVHGFSIGGKMTLSEQVALSGGVTYQFRGDATTESIGAKFENNSVVAAGMKISYSF